MCELRHSDRGDCVQTWLFQRRPCSCNVCVAEIWQARHVLAGDLVTMAERTGPRVSTGLPAAEESQAAARDLHGALFTRAGSCGAANRKAFSAPPGAPALFAHANWRPFAKRASYLEVPFGAGLGANGPSCDGGDNLPPLSRAFRAPRVPAPWVPRWAPLGWTGHVTPLKMAAAARGRGTWRTRVVRTGSLRSALRRPCRDAFPRRRARAPSPRTRRPGLSFRRATRSARSPCGLD